MNISLNFNYTVKDIEKLEKDIINKNNEWLNNSKDLNADDFLNSYLYNSSEFNYIFGSIKFLHQWKFKTPIF